MLISLWWFFLTGADGTFDILKYADPELDLDDPNLIDSLELIDDPKTSSGEGEGEEKKDDVSKSQEKKALERSEFILAACLHGVMLFWSVQTFCFWNHPLFFVCVEGTDIYYVSNIYYITTRGCTSSGVNVPCIYSHARWELL